MGWEGESEYFFTAIGGRTGIVKVRTMLGWAIAVLLALPVSPASALDIPAELKKRLLSEGDPKAKELSIDGESPDNSIDPESYLVGGGDGFRISIVGMPSDEYLPVVDPNGNLYDGELGLIPLGRITLTKALGLIQDRVKRSLRKNYEIYVTLRKVKRVNVTVTGAVNIPGTYQLPGTYRLLDALRAANGGQLSQLAKFDFRNVRVRNRDTVRTYDLFKFFSKGDLSQNPYIYPGDNLTLNPVDAKIYVSGEVLDPVIGWVPLVRGETLADLLGILNFKQSADSSAILVQQADSPSRRTLKKLSVAEAAHFLLLPNALVTIGSKDESQRPDTVQLNGEVMRPGTYPVLSSQATLREIIEMAGGPTELGDPSRTVVIRHRKSENIMGRSEQERMITLHGRPASIPAGVRSVRPEISSSISDLQTLGDYSLVRAANLDVKASLQDGDEIFVPRNDPFVYVSGNVRRPGAYPWSKGKDAGDYVKDAGGYTGKADTQNRFVLASYNGVSQIRDVAELGQGDMLVVPAAIEYKRFNNVALPILQILPGVLSVIVTLIVLERQK